MINCTYFITTINNARVARLDTNDSGLKPYLVPVVFVYDNDGSYYIPIDKKFKQSSKLIKTGKEYWGKSKCCLAHRWTYWRMGETLFYYDPRNNFTDG